MCFGGVKMDPTRHPCNAVSWISSIISIKTIGVVILIFGGLYYGWPLIEAILLILPIPDPKDSI